MIGRSFSNLIICPGQDLLQRQKEEDPDQLRGQMLLPELFFLCWNLICCMVLTYKMSIKAPFTNLYRITQTYQDVSWANTWSPSCNFNTNSTSETEVAQFVDWMDGMVSGCVDIQSNLRWWKIKICPVKKPTSPSCSCCLCKQISSVCSEKTFNLLKQTVCLHCR